jgi:hypothetical protein
MMRKLLVIVLVALFFVSCGKIDTVFSVNNNSSYTVSMSNIQNADVTEISEIPPGTSTKITFKIALLEDTAISFSFTPANLVNGTIDSTGAKITFSNK